MALIPPVFFDCVMAIGNSKKGDDFRWIGTSILIGRLLKSTDDGEKLYNTFLVTNKHVLEGEKSIVVRFNLKSDSSAKDYPIEVVDKDGNFIWTEHPNPDIDIAVISINPATLESKGLKFSYFRSDENILTKKEMAENGITEGDFVYSLGFPMALLGADSQYVIARYGTIARIRDLLDGRQYEFLVDMSAFPGSSGSPVILKPEFTHIQGTKNFVRSCMIGIVRSNIPFQDEAISQQTGLRVVFQENSGLALIIPVDYIMETIEIAYNKISSTTGSESSSSSNS